MTFSGTFLPDYANVIHIIGINGTSNTTETTVEDTDILLVHVCLHLVVDGLVSSMAQYHYRCPDNTKWTRQSPLLMYHILSYGRYYGSACMT